MAITYERRKNRQHNIFYTLITVILTLAVFFSMVSFFYTEAENEAYEMLHLQTKQIKDDLTLQIKSDRENLITMANFASRLYSDGKSYDRMFDSFKPIGLFSNIGILNPDNVFVTKKGSVDLNGKISFEEEAKRGEYISGRIPDLTREGSQIIRSAVPIKDDFGNVVGILYGVIHLDTIAQKYEKMAEELDAQLFVYDKETGNFVIDTINDTYENISVFKDREYNNGYSYKEIIENENGYSSFKSILKNENLYTHYSTIEDFGWGIMLARYESQVFERANEISRVLLRAFLSILLIMVAYILLLLVNEKRSSVTVAHASDIRKLLLDVNQQSGNINEALRKITEFSASRSAILVDTDGEDYNYISPSFEKIALSDKDRKYFVSEVLHYAGKLHNINKKPVGLVCLTPDNHLAKTNNKLYSFLLEHKIKEVSFASIINKNNHITILGVLNPAKSKLSRTLLSDIAICFSIAIFNKKHLDKTEAATTTDSLTGAHNRVSYKKDIMLFDEEKPSAFTCIYVDVNELHLRNNKYGHAAGDEMLIYIANTLKEVFFGHYIYRMGGDEFLVFIKGDDPEVVKNNIQLFIQQLAVKDYHVAIGMSYRTQNNNTEEMVREAEVRMYDAKAQYYQNKEHSVARVEDDKYVQIVTGISEIDGILSMLKDHYNGIYRVSLDTDKARRILMPSYLGYHENEEHFSQLVTKYITDTVYPDFHRAVLSFLNYEALKAQLSEGNIPRITYKKNNGETVILSIYGLDDSNNTLWVFAKD